MTPWLLSAAVLVAAVVALVGAGGLSVQRYSGSHVVARLAVAGRGLYVSRTADGTWWRVRLRPCRRRCEDRSSWGDPPPDSGVREPRRPRGPGPVAGTVKLDPPL